MAGFSKSAGPFSCAVSLFVLLGPLPCAWSGEQTPDDGAVSYWRDIRPLFQAHCQGCHQPAKASGQYIMTSFAALLAGGESGDPAVVPGDPDASYLVQQITASDGEAAMPKDRPPLTDEQIARIRQWIAAGANDDTPASALEQYDLQHPPHYTVAPVITAIAPSPDGRLLALSGYHEVLVLDAQKLLSGQLAIASRLIGMSERIESIAFSPDGTKLAVAGGSPGRLGEVQIWRVEGPELITALAASYDTCYGVSWSPDGRAVAFGLPDNTVRAIEAESGKQVLFNGAHNDWVLDTVFSVDGSHLVSVSRDRSMKLIEVATERFIDNITSITPGALKGGLHAVDRHPERDELLIGGADGVPKIYRMFREKNRQIGDDFNLIRALPEMPGRVFDVAFGPKGELAVAGSSLDGTGHVHVFRCADGQRLAEMEQIQGGIYAVAFSADGRFVASGGYEGKLYVHQAETGKLLVELAPVPLESESCAAGSGDPRRAGEPRRAHVSAISQEDAP